MKYVPVGPVEADLSPCPFCGGEAVLENVVCEAYVRCLRCRAKIIRHHYDNNDSIAISDVTRAWNRRTGPRQGTGLPDNESGERNGP